MGYGTIRISQTAHETLRELAQAEGKPMLALLDEAVEALRRQRFLEEVNAAYAALRAESTSWEEFQTECRAWDATLADGLAVAEPHAPYDPRRPPAKGRKRP